MNIFEKATRLGLRFDFAGNTSVEQLWKANFEQLVDYEALLKDKVKSFGESSRRTKTARTKDQELTMLRLEIVSYILDAREQEAEEQVKAADAKANKQRILELIKRKEEEDLASLPIEELRKMLGN